MNACTHTELAVKLCILQNGIPPKVQQKVQSGVRQMIIAKVGGVAVYRQSLHEVEVPILMRRVIVRLEPHL